MVELNSQARQGFTISGVSNVRLLMEFITQKNLQIRYLNYELCDKDKGAEKDP